MTVAEPELACPWLASYPADVLPSIVYPDTSIGALLDQIESLYPDADAIVFQRDILTWRDVQRLSRRLSHALRRLGVRKGDRVVLLLPNVPHFVIGYYAVLKLGAVVVAANPLFTDRDLEGYIKKTGARVIITLDVLYEKIGDQWRDIGVEHVGVGTAIDLMSAKVRFASGFVSRLYAWSRKLSQMNSGAGGYAERLLKRASDRSENIARILDAPRPKAPVPYGGGVQRFRDLLAEGSDQHIEVDVASGDLAVLMYTTGTTGMPKAAMLTHANLIANAYQMRNWFPELKDGEETILAVLPFFHCYGLTLVMNCGLVLAARSVLIPRLILKDIFDAIEAFKPTALPGVPALFVSMVNSDRTEKYDLRSIRVCVSGGAPLPVEIKERFDALTGGHLYEGYGLTEASPLTHAQPHDQSAPAGSMGIPVADTDARIVDDAGNQVPVGEPGELVVRGPQVMDGYWQEPQETADVLSDGWLKTGDIARMDENGFFFIVDRKKELIITGGENIAPREIEEALYRHPKVEEAAVAGVPHGVGGEIAKAFIVLKPGESSSAREMKQFLSGELAHYKVPREIEFRTDLPKSPMGKILRRLLVEEEKQKAAHKAG